MPQFEYWGLITSSFRDHDDLTVFVEKLLRLVHLCRKVRTAASIGMVKKHEVSMSLADLVLANSSFTRKC